MPVFFESCQFGASVLTALYLDAVGPQFEVFYSFPCFLLFMDAEKVGRCEFLTASGPLSAPLYVLHDGSLFRRVD